MTAQPLSPEEAAVVARFEAAEYPPEVALAAVLARESRAFAEVARLCEGGRWTMRVPVDEDRDSDTVIAASLADVPRLVDIVREIAELAESYPLGTDVPVYRLHRALRDLGGVS